MWRAFAVKIAGLVAIFIAVPWILYGQFRAADIDKQQLLLKSAQEQGRMVVESVRPLLTQFNPATVRKLEDALVRIGGPESKIKVLFRPTGASGPDAFYYVASVPAVPSSYLESERRELIDSGIFSRVPDSCDRVDSEAARLRNPAGQEELLVSLNPVSSSVGCWVLITSSAASEFLGSGIGRPYWQTPEVRLAAIIYLIMAVFVILLFLDGWSSLRRFAGHARRIGARGPQGATFAALNRVPELDGVAREFDRMVESLRNSARLMRYAAEDNAHAFKTPIAVITQALEPLRRAADPDDARVARAVEMIEHSVNRLDALVSAARRMDEAAAEIIDPDRAQVDVAQLIRRIAADYAETLDGRRVKLSVSAPESAVVMAQEDLLDSVFENLIENAVSFSPAGEVVDLSLRVEKGEAEILVEDRGPGVNELDLERIFDRYHSNRPPDNGADGAAHFGVGLWIVRRNIEAIGGEVSAENREGGGLVIRMCLPLA